MPAYDSDTALRRAEARHQYPPENDPAQWADCEFCEHEHPKDKMLFMGVTEGYRRLYTCKFTDCLELAVPFLTNWLATERREVRRLREKCGEA
jgi:hypothetical protein